MFVNPTGLSIRNDSKGLGHHGAPRGLRKHNGIDLLCTPNQPIKMPVAGIIVRESLPYKDNLEWRGVHIVSDRIELKLWYFLPDLNLIGSYVRLGDIIGYAQDISRKYSGVLPHVHLRVVTVDPMLIFFNETGFLSK